MSELVSSKQIAEEVKIAVSLVVNYLDAAKVPAHKLLAGTETLSLYDKGTAFKAVNARVQEEKMIASANLARLEAAKIPTLRDLMLAIKTMGVDLSELAEAQEEIKRLNTQNQQIFKVLTAHKDDTADQLAGLKTLIVNLRNTAIVAPSANTTKAVHQIAVVGIAKMHHATMAAEYGDLVYLKLLDQGDIRGIHGLRGYDKVFLVKATTDYKHTEQLKAVKANVEAVASIDQLKERLTAYCVSL